jgi:hypothetical protein
MLEVFWIITDQQHHFSSIKKSVPDANYYITTLEKKTCYTLLKKQIMITILPNEQR